MMRIIYDDLQKYGTCRYTVAKETFMFAPATIGLPKRSQFTDDISMMLVNNKFILIEGFFLLN